MEKRTRTYSQTLKREFLLRLTQEKVLICLLVFSLAYALISNIISRYCHIECVAELSNMGNAIDELLKNICYSIIAGIVFYIINDLYKNVVKRVSEMDKMFHELLYLQVNANILLSYISSDKYEKSMSREQAFQCIMKYMCNEDIDFNIVGSVSKTRTIAVNVIAILVDKWREIKKMQATFLVTYGDLLEREDILKLNRCNDYLDSEMIDYLLKQLENTNEEFVQILEHDIAFIVNRFIGYKMYLTNLAKKYIHYNYSRNLYLNRQCTVEDFE